MSRIGIIGSGDHAKVIRATTRSGYGMVTLTVEELTKDDRAIIGFVGKFGTDNREKISLALSDRPRFSVIANDVTLMSDTNIDKGKNDRGIFVGHRAIVEIAVRVDFDCVIMPGVIVSHDCTLGRDVFVGPGTVLCGRVAIGDHSRIGAGCTILPGIKIGHHVIVGAGSVVTKDVPPGVTVMGNPARTRKAS